MKTLAAITVLALVCAGSFAGTITTDYGWENGGTILATASGANAIGSATNVSSPVHGGTYALDLTNKAGNTTASYSYLGWVQGLQVGDVVTASFWVYDTTPTGSPSGRIWGHYDDSTTGDATLSNGSASGNSTYSDGNGWSQLSYTWTIPAGHTGLMVEARTYWSGGTGTDIYIDDMSITAPDTASVVLPIPEPMTLSLLAMGGLGILVRGRRRNS